MLSAASPCAIASEMVAVTIVTGSGEGARLQVVAMVPHCESVEKMLDIRKIEIRDNQQIYCGKSLLIDGEYFNSRVL